MSKKDKTDVAELIGVVLMLVFFMGLMFFSPMF